MFFDECRDFFVGDSRFGNVNDGMKNMKQVFPFCYRAIDARLFEGIGHAQRIAVQHFVCAHVNQHRRQSTQIAIQRGNERRA